MRFVATHSFRPILVIGLVAFSTMSHAAEDSYVAAMRYVSLDAQGDDANTKQYSGTGSFTLGRNVWLKGLFGKIIDDSSASLGDLKNVGIGTGFKNQYLQLSLDFSQYKNDTSYKQSDVYASVDWIQSRFGVGLDAMHRTTDNSIDVTRSFPVLGTVAYRAEEQITGNGFGLHADFNVTDALNLSVGAMTYNYDSSYTLTSSTNPALVRRLLTRYPTLSESFYLNNSGLTRALALLDNSFNVGLSYQFSAMNLAAQYLRDKALETGDITNTVILNAAIFIGDAWMLNPSIGQSKADNADKITFGGVALTYNF